jgi:glucose-1-phosphate cytidylyltransferase
MKVVLFCGGLGTRLRAHSERIPKPMVEIGNRPILWHIMKYYAHFGHKDFILCLGYMGEVIKEYFLGYDEWVSNDFVLRKGGDEIELVDRDLDDWTIRFVDTGVQTNIGGRLRAVREFLEGEEMFLASYTDSVTDADLGAYLEAFRRSDAVGSMLAVRPDQSFHTLELGKPNDGLSPVDDVRDARSSDFWINGGFFAFRPEIFDRLQPGEELVEEPLRRLVDEGKLFAYRHDGYWASMDTYKDKKRFDALYDAGDHRWEVWRTS